MTKNKTCRVDKLLASMGYGTRSEIAFMARSGGIVLDNDRLDDATKRIPISPDLPVRMSVRGDGLDPLSGMVVIMNKPLGMTCSRVESGPLVYDLLPERWKRRLPALSTIGRLDKSTSGLLLLTDDGDLLHRVISPKRRIKKTYRASLLRPLSGNEGDLFASGTMLLKGEKKPLAPAELVIVSRTEALLCVTEGRYHQVRRMFAATGNHVERLHRERVGNLSLPGNIRPGEWKLLSTDEIGLVLAGV